MSLNPNCRATVPGCQGGFGRVSATLNGHPIQLCWPKEGNVLMRSSSPGIRGRSPYKHFPFSILKSPYLNATPVVGGSHNSGFALLAVLWCIGIMTLAVLGLIGFVALQLDECIAQAKDFRAAQLAESGLALALHPSVQALDPILKRQFSKVEKFEVTVKSEGGRFNLNRMLLSGQTTKLSRLWVQWGLTDQEASSLNDCLMDWIDSDDLRRLNGAERNEYAALGFPSYPANQPFQSLDEISRVIGFDRVIKLRPDWKDFFTVWTDGQLDLNEAPPELLAATFNFSLKQAEDFALKRSQLTPPGSLAPYRFKSADQARAMMGLSKDEFNLAVNFVTIENTYIRIESRGIVDRHVHTLVVVTRKGGNTPVYYLWQEL